MADLFGSLDTAPPDSVLRVAAEFKADTNPKKVNLGVGCYRTEEAKPWILPTVRMAEEQMLKELGDKRLVQHGR